MRYAVLAGLALAFFALPSPIRAQAEVCGKVDTTVCAGGGAHKVLLEVPALSKGTHSDCRVCSGQYISDCHPSDGCAEMFEFGAMAVSAFRSILESANEGDVGAILALSREVQGAVFYNAQRNAVQILDCSRSQVMASIRVRDRTLQAVAARALPSDLALNTARREVAVEF